jgi:hypothetical protein
MSTHYTETYPLDWGDLVAIPHFTITVDAGYYDMDGDAEVIATLSHVMLGHLCPRGKVEGIELTTTQAEQIWGAKAVEAWEEAAVESFDWESALRDEADDRADYIYERKRDERMETE